MQWDADGTIRPKRPAKTNAERQRAFRERNPEYYMLLQRERRAAVKALGEMRRLEAQQAAVTVVRKEPLMLPAPVETIELPGLTTPISRDAVPFPELVELIR